MIIDCLYKIGVYIFKGFNFKKIIVRFAKLRFKVTFLIGLMSIGGL